MKTVENLDVGFTFRFVTYRMWRIDISFQMMLSSNTFFKFFRNRDVLQSGDNDFMSNNNAKDWFYWTVNNIADLGALGIEEDALNKCIKGLDFQ